jgi:hypothetical protein
MSNASGKCIATLATLATRAEAAMLLIDLDGCLERC